jgi:hypothetical protein
MKPAMPESPAQSRKDYQVREFSHSLGGKRSPGSIPNFSHSAFPDQGERSKHVPDGDCVPRQMFRNPKPYHFHLFGYVIQQANDLWNGHSPLWNAGKKMAASRPRNAVSVALSR